MIGQAIGKRADRFTDLAAIRHRLLPLNPIRLQIGE
jgi:hypothetical protein